MAISGTGVSLFFSLIHFVLQLPNLVCVLCAIIFEFVAVLGLVHAVTTAGKKT